MDILDKLYYGKINEYSNPITTTKESKKLSTIYKNLKQQLNSNQLKLLEQYINLQDIINEKVYKEKYKQGFKTGLMIGVECKNNIL